MILLDFILLAPLLFGLVRGLFNGLIKELVSIAAVIIGIFLAFQYAEEVEIFLSKYIDQDGTGLTILAYLLIFGVVMLIAFALSFLLTKILQAMSLGLVNRILGGVFGFGKSLLILLVIINLIDPFISTSEEFATKTSKSQVYQSLLAIDTHVETWLPPDQRPFNAEDQFTNPE